MAKKRKRTIRAIDDPDHDEDEGEWEEEDTEQQDQPKPEPAPKPPAPPRIMVTWNGEGESKTWNGITFEKGVAQDISGSPWKDAMRVAIDGSHGKGDWKYEYALADEAA